MKFYIIYEENALATIKSDIEGPYKDFKTAQERAAKFNASQYDVCVIAKINDEWCRLEEMDEGIFYKLLEKDEEYWMPLAQAGKV